MPKYRRKPAPTDNMRAHYRPRYEVDAVQLISTSTIPTRSGMLHASEGDWVIRHGGNTHVCKPDEFAETYEAVDVAEI